MMKFATMAVAGAVILTGKSTFAVVELADEQQIINYPAPSGTANLSYNEFNPALGQLIDITISLDTYDTALSEVFSAAGPGVSYSGASVSSASETVNALGLSTSTTSLEAGPFDGTTTGWITVAGSGPTQHLTASEIVLPANFASFIGTGLQPFNVSIVPGTGTYSGTGPSSLVGFAGAVNSYGTIEIDYDYIATAVAVPEASQSAIYASGIAALVGIGGLIFRTRRLVA